MKRNILLIGGAALSVGWLVRIILTGNNLFGFLIWNVFLAAVPLIIEPAFSLVRHHAHGAIRNIGKFVLSATWLLFLPNAFYLLTDFMHLNSAVLVNQRNDNQHYSTYYTRGDGIYIYDSLLLFCATAFGAYAGGLALYHAYSFLHRRIGHWRTSAAIGGVMLLSSVGVYLGRFGRWNSWQAITHPWGIITDLGSTLSHPVYRQRFFTVVFTMFIFTSASMAIVAYGQRSKSSARTAGHVKSTKSGL